MLPVTVFKDLCLDACDASLVAPFWAAALGLRAEPQDGGDWVLRGPTPQHTVWVNTVPEPQTVKNRVHLDVRFPDGLPDLPVVSTHERWTVLEGPEGLQLCGFGGTPAGCFELVVDAADPLAIATWWAERFEVPVHDEGKPWVWLEGVPGLPWDYWVFNPVPEPKTVKNRVHWDVTGTVDELERAGATALAVLPSWTVMADPEGNEFCVFS